MKTAIDNNPTNIFHHRIYGWVLYMARRYDEAIEELKGVVEMDPSSPSTYDNLWLAYHAKGDHARAFEWFMKFHYDYSPCLFSKHSKSVCIQTFSIR